MTKYLAGVLTVIAAGVLLIAYGLLSPRAAAFAAPGDLNQFGQPMFAGERAFVEGDPYSAQPRYGFNDPASAQPVPVSDVRSLRQVNTVSAPARARASATRLEPRRDWKKTALLIGGSTAGGAGLGAIFGGRKGALIGAALGGGASTIYEATKR